MKSFKLGFTIIETMLFLAITGLLVAGVLVGAGTSIGTQRYNDSVRSFQNELKKAYNDVVNVSNDRSTDISCVEDSSTIKLVTNSKSNLGQSDCVIMGKYITNGDNNTVSIENVLGYDNEAAVKGIDVSDFNNYLFAVDSSSNESYSLEWGASVSSWISSNSSSNNFSILILRSPTSGLVRTFVDPDTSYSVSAISSLIRSNYLTNQAKLCVDPNGLSNTPKMAVLINANATSASDVETLGSDSGC